MCFRMLLPQYHSFGVRKNNIKGLIIRISFTLKKKRKKKNGPEPIHPLRKQQFLTHSLHDTHRAVDSPSAILNLRGKLLTTTGIVGSRGFPAARARASLTCLHLQLKGYPRRPMQRQLIDVIFSDDEIFSGQSLHQEVNFRPKISRR